VEVRILRALIEVALYVVESHKIQGINLEHVFNAYSIAPNVKI
jgi:hypothetical protein